MLFLAVRARYVTRLAALLLAACAAPSIAQDDENAGEDRLNPYAQAVLDADRAMETGEFGDWTIACDNWGACTLIGIADSADPNHIVSNATRSLAMRIVIDPRGRVSDMQFIPDRQISEQVTDGIDWTGPFRLSIPNLRGAPIAVPYTRTQLDPTSATAVYRYLLTGGRLVGTSPLSGEERIRLPYVGFADAIAGTARRRQAIQVWRRRTNPDDAPVQIERSARPFMVSGYLPVTAEQMDWCGSGVDASDLSAFDMGGGQQLWVHRCPVSDGRNILSRLFMVQVGTTVATPLRLPRGMGAAIPIPGRGLPNASFDFDFGVLRAYDYAWPGHEDCGRMAIWGWTGTAFVLLRKEIMTGCNGLTPGDWLVTYRREVAPERWAQ